MKITKRKTFLLGILAGMLMIPTPVSAETLSLPVAFSESQSQTQSRTVTLPKNAVITDVQVDNGTVTHNKNGDNLTVTVSGGAPFSDVYNPHKFSRFEYASQTNSTNSFPGSISYNSGGYSGTLTKNGGSYVSSGSYTPADSFFVTGQTSSYYNSGGYSGSLSSYVYSGSYTPADSQYLTGISSGSYTWGDVCMGGDGSTTWKSEASVKPSSTRSYNSGGYSGTLSLYTWSGIHEQNGNTCGSKRDPLRKYKNHYDYRGTVSRPASDTRTYRYQGTVYKPASDTRRFTQEYSGTVYSGGYDTTYKYNVEVSYVIDELGIPLFVIKHEEEWTNKDIVIQVKVFPSQGKKIQSVILPNGSLVNTTSFNYTVSENGVYTFTAIDERGATGYGSAIIKNIDKSKPSVELEPPTNWIKEEPLIDIKGVK